MVTRGRGVKNLKMEVTSFMNALLGKIFFSINQNCVGVKSVLGEDPCTIKNKNYLLNMTLKCNYLPSKWGAYIFANYYMTVPLVRHAIRDLLMHN